MEECMKKLALWNTRYFKPIITHDDLDPIMTSIGFIGLPPSSGTKAYVYYGKYSKLAEAAAKEATSPPPRPSLPYPRIDGLHICTYRAFIEAIDYYLRMSNISDLFHLRGMPLHKIYDKSGKWCLMEEDKNLMEEDKNTYVYRDGTLDQSNGENHKSEKQNCFKGYESWLIRDKSKKVFPVDNVVPLKNITTWYE